MQRRTEIVPIRVLQTPLSDRADSGTGSIQLSEVTQVPKHLQPFLQGCCLLSPAKEISSSSHVTRNRTQTQCKNQTTLNTREEESSVVFLPRAALIPRGINAKKREAHAEGTLHHTLVISDRPKLLTHTCFSATHYH